jgi:hypothetical protein
VADLVQDRGAAFKGSGAVGRRVKRERERLLRRIRRLRDMRQHQVGTARGAELQRSA